MSKALLLIHGFLTGADDWDVLLPYVSSLYDRVEVFRQPGHERAGDKPHYKDFTEPAVYAAMDAALDKLADCDRVDVLGHSMGGGVAAYACAKLKNVGRAVMYAPAFKYPRTDILLKQNAVAKKLGAMAKSCPDERSRRRSKNGRTACATRSTRQCRYFSGGCCALEPAQYDDVYARYGGSAESLPAVTCRCAWSGAISTN